MAGEIWSPFFKLENLFSDIAEDHFELKCTELRQTMESWNDSFKAPPTITTSKRFNFNRWMMVHESNFSNLTPPEILAKVDPIMPPEVLENSPSIVDGLDVQLESAIRATGCYFIRRAGILLKLQQPVIVFAQVIYHRFYFEKSFVSYSYELIAATCLYIACHCNHIQMTFSTVAGTFIELDQIFTTDIEQASRNIEDQEMIVLLSVKTTVNVSQPYLCLLSLIKHFGLFDNESLVYTAIAHLNDSFLTDVCCRYTAEVIASASLNFTLVLLGVCKDLGFFGLKKIFLSLDKTTHITAYTVRCRGGDTEKCFRSGNVYSHQENFATRANLEKCLARRLQIEFRKATDCL